MITSTVENLPSNTATINITISWDEIEETYNSVFDKVVSEIELPGFRKGKAPKDLVREKVNKTKIYEEVVKQIIPKAYSEAVKNKDIKPVSSPKIEVLKAKEKEDWVIKATIALKPKVNLKNYKDKIKELKKGKTKIWTPGAKEDKPDAKEEKPSLDEIIKVLLDEAEVEISDLLVEDEANRLLSNLVDQTQKLGMTVEQYLMAKGKTTEQIRADYASQAANNIKIEFILAEIADKENIVVTPEEINKLVEKVEKPEEKDRLKKESYYIAHLIRQQKTFDFLNAL